MEALKLKDVKITYKESGLETGKMACSDLRYD
jgi:hypothetical protein